jgi:ATP-dependent protease ClpP protease subunit
MEKVIWGGKLEKGNKTQADKDKTVTPSVIGNHIYFYSDVDTEPVLSLVKSLREMDMVNMSNFATKQQGSIDSIFLHINSLGGYLYEGFAAMDCILNCKSPVITIVEGMAASAATFLSLAGTRRLITRHSYMMIHQLSSVFWGKYSEIKDEQKNLDLYMKQIYEVYKEYTEVPEKAIAEILKHDLDWDAKTCLKYGLVDEIIS